MFDFAEIEEHTNTKAIYVIKQKALKRTLEKVNASPNTFITLYQIKRVIKIWGLLSRFYAATLNLMPFSSDKTELKDYTKSGFLRITFLGFLSIRQDLLLHNMYLNGYFTDIEWAYIKDRLYSKIYTQYFNNLNNKKWVKSKKLEQRLKTQAIVEKMQILAKGKSMRRYTWEMKKSRAYKKFLLKQKKKV